MNDLINISGYRNWLEVLKMRIKGSQIRAALSVNRDSILLYWYLEKHKIAEWGNSVINQLSQDLCNAFESTAGFSKSNIYAMKNFYEFFHQVGGKLESVENVEVVKIDNVEVVKIDNEIYLPEIVEKYCLNIPCRHIVLLLQKVKNQNEMLFYLNETIENNWNRNVLNIQIESDLYKRQDKAVANFANTLPLPEADLLNETLKNHYNFVFLTLERNAREKDLERGLVANISKFIMERGKGFAFLGEQYQLTVNHKDYFLDLLFYHVKLHCYVVVELKTGEFKIEYLEKMNFYLSAVDDLLKSKNDNQTIGILLCKNQNSIDVEFVLRDINKPIGVSEFSFNELPETIRQEMPSEEELQKELLG